MCCFIEDNNKNKNKNISGIVNTITEADWEKKGL